MTAKIVKGWHFLAADKRLGYGDSREAVAGKILKVDCEPVLCESGLHWSPRLIDAIKYAPGPILCRVSSVHGHKVIHGNDKSVSTARKVVAMVDATDLLFELSRLFAARVFWQHFKREDYPAVVAWLDHGDFSQRSAAWSAAESAAESAARSAARSAAESAARSAAWSAAWSAAESAAESAARSAAESAARSAARSAAESAAWSAMNEIVESKALALMGLSAAD